tara:strand:+ start:304 stop:798 length:495 start_codon:yes stop_codon:yes gene_type:complete
MKNSGFTLIELLVTMVVMSILIAVGVPSFNHMILKYSVNGDRDTLFNSLIYARTEAIKRGQTISICKSINLSTCDTSAAWNDGWIVFEDTNGNGALSGETILRVQDALKRDMSVSFDGGDFVTFDGLGKASDTSGTFSFSHSSADTAYDRTVTLSSTGRSRKAS